MAKFTWTENYLTVQREEGDPKFYGVATGESRLLHYLKTQLNAQGYDLIKKRMWKDGHLMDDTQQYLRTRSPKSKGPHVFIWNGQWAIRGAEVDWNEGSVTFELATDVFANT